MEVGCWVWCGSELAGAGSLLGVFPQRSEMSLQQIIRKHERPPGSKMKSEPQGAIGKLMGSLPTSVFSAGRIFAAGCSFGNTKDASQGLELGLKDEKE